MPLSQKELDKITRLAYLQIDEEHAPQLSQEISAIMDFVDELRSVETTGIAPLFHPFDLHQRLRSDEVTEESCLAELESLAPMFEDDYYLVPKVLESGK